MINIFNYVDRSSPIHKLTGASKLICLLMFSISSMTSFYTPFLAFIAAAAIVVFLLSRIRLRDVSFLVGAVTVFMLLNNLLIFLFSPEHGVSIYGTRHVLFTITKRYVVTSEQLYYHLNLFLKYLCTIPVVIIFVCTTNPSEFAASLNRIGVSYRVSYAVALSLRYIPDIQQEYHAISQAQQARGVEMSKKASLVSRLKAASAILIPLVLSSMERIENVSNAMELRCFGKEKKRTWYAYRPFAAGDFAAIAFGVFLLAASIFLTYYNGSRFFNPFL